MLWQTETGELFHKILGNEDPTPEKLIEVKKRIQQFGLIARMPNEWRELLPQHLQSTPVVWLIGPDRLVKVKKDLLDADRLLRLNIPGVDWWVYAGNISPEAVIVQTLF